MNLKDKTILVTGASSGIGRGIAIAAAEKGATVLINYRKNKSGAEETLAAVEKFSRGFIFQADLTKKSQREKMFAAIAKKVGTIDILINNAGEAQPNNLFDDATWHEQFENIFFSAVHTTQLFLQQNKKSPLRKIINVSSYYGRTDGGNPEYSAYSAAKAALANFTITLAKMDARVNVNAVAPAYTWTKEWEGTSRKEKSAYARRMKINRFIEPAEVAHMSIALLENDAVTGQIITIDGGLSISQPL